MQQDDFGMIRALQALRGAEVRQDTHKKCTRHIGGWPYLHVFHWYLRF